MSRSRKKIPLLKDGSRKINWYNKSYRRTCRLIANRLKYKEDLDFPDQKEVTNDYDICDWKISPAFQNSWDVKWRAELTRKELFKYTKK